MQVSREAILPAGEPGKPSSVSLACPRLGVRILAELPFTQHNFVLSMQTGETSFVRSRVVSQSSSPHFQSAVVLWIELLQLGDSFSARGLSGAHVWLIHLGMRNVLGSEEGSE